MCCGEILEKTLLTLLWISTIIYVLKFKIPRMQLAAEEPQEARALTI
jgi:hypothetical protein